MTNLGDYSWMLYTIYTIYTFQLNLIKFQVLFYLFIYFLAVFIRSWIITVHQRYGILSVFMKIYVYFCNNYIYIS